MAEQLAQRQVEEATAARRSAQSALNVAQQNMADLERWLAEIARDPLQRTALEQVASQVSTRALALQESLTLARFEQEDTESRLASLVARRNQLNDTLVDVNGRIPGAQTEVEAAQAAADAASAELFDFIATGE
jgi:chromosome segregation ATPase